ncbi:hypothetical protein FB480_10688 [Agrobacterium vitis]|nr:hypothetical protein FB480_10688 [Agrobacterium vitis]
MARSFMPLSLDARHIIAQMNDRKIRQAESAFTCFEALAVFLKRHGGPIAFYFREAFGVPGGKEGCLASQVCLLAKDIKVKALAIASHPSQDEGRLKNHATSSPPFLAPTFRIRRARCASTVRTDRPISSAIS